MNRKPTPSILDELLSAKSETTELRSGLKWDYSQLGDAAGAVMGHAVEIKRSERRASEAIVEAGRHLIAVKQALSHGQWEDWLQTEFAMSDRTARRMMAVAEQFGGKTDTVSVLSPSVLYLLAGDSVPEPAREVVIDLAKNGETVTKAQAQAVIDQHKPQPGSPEARRLTKEIKAATWADRRITPTAVDIELPAQYSAHYERCQSFTDGRYAVWWRNSHGLQNAEQFGDYASMIRWLDERRHSAPTPVVVDGERPLPDWAADDADADLTAADVQVLKPMPAAACTPADDRRARLAQWQLLFEDCLSALSHWADLTGRFTCTGEAERGLRKLLDATRSEIAAINGQAHSVAWGEEVAA